MRPSAIDVDDWSTWPDDVLELIEAGRTFLHQWLERDPEIDHAMQRDVDLRITPPANAYRAQRTRFIDAVDQAISGGSVLGWHCTRLHPAEADEVRAEGLHPGTGLRLERRIASALDLGLISSATATALLADHDADWPNRIGRLYFGFGASELRSPGAVGRQLTLWGGEALFHRHEETAREEDLRRVGSASIVLAAVPISILNTYVTVGERVADAVARDDTARFEGWTSEPIRPSWIVDILTPVDPGFERLTGCSTWPIAVT